MLSYVYSVFSPVRCFCFLDHELAIKRCAPNRAGRPQFRSRPDFPGCQGPGAPGSSRGGTSKSKVHEGLRSGGDGQFRYLLMSWPGQDVESASSPSPYGSNWVLASCVWDIAEIMRWL